MNSMKDILVKTNDELAHDIVNYFFHAGETVSKEDYDFVLNILTQKDAEVERERERIVETIKDTKCPDSCSEGGTPCTYNRNVERIIYAITNKGDTNN